MIFTRIRLENASYLFPSATPAKAEEEKSGTDLSLREDLNDIKQIISENNDILVQKLGEITHEIAEKSFQTAPQEIISRLGRIEAINEKIYNKVEKDDEKGFGKVEEIPPAPTQPRLEVSPASHSIHRESSTRRELSFSVEVEAHVEHEDPDIPPSPPSVSVPASDIHATQTEESQPPPSPKGATTDRGEQILSKLEESFSAAKNQRRDIAGKTEEIRRCYLLIFATRHS